MGAAGNFAAAEAFTRRGKVARSAGWGQHPLALLRPLSQALSGLPALPKGEPRALPETLSLPLKAVPLRADFPRPGEGGAQRRMGAAPISPAAPSQSSPVGFASSPKGRAKSTAGNFIATAKSRPLEGRLPPAGGRCRAATKGGVWHRRRR